MNRVPADEPTLYVDLDGTLIAGDTLVLSLVNLLSEKPWAFVFLPLHALRGRAAFKDRVTRLIALDPQRLPYRPRVIAFLREEKARGRSLVLATAAHRRIAHSVADFLGVFDDVIASDDTRNLKGPLKLAAILEHAPSGVFDYAGDSRADLPIFERARASILVCPSASLLARARAISLVARVFE
jgi:phosphoserine phosphatase